MKTRISTTLCLKMLIIINCLICFSPTVIGKSHKGKDVVLKMASVYKSDTPLGLIPNYLKKKFDFINAGVKIKVFEPGELFKTFDLVKEISKGKKANAGYSSSGYWTESISKAAALFAAYPFGPDAKEYLAWLLEGDGTKLWQEMFDRYGYNVKVMACGIIPPETLWFAKPVKDTKDLKGVKMRIFGLGGEVMKKFGVEPVLLPGHKILEALKKGEIHTAEYSTPNVDEKLGIYKIVKYNYLPGWHQQSTILELLINKDTWKGMTKGQQELIKMGCAAANVKQFALGEASNFLPLKRNVETRGVKIKIWSPEMLKEFENAWKEVVKDLRKDEFFSHVWENLNNFRDNYRFWKETAYLK